MSYRARESICIEVGATLTFDAWVQYIVTGEPNWEAEGHE